MKKRWIYFSIILSIFAACTQKQREGWQKRVEKIKDGETAVAETGEVEKITPGEAKSRFLKLQVAEAHVQRLVDAVEAPAVLRPGPNAQAVIKAPVQGWIKDLRVEPGSMVKKNDLLALIENPNNLGQRLRVEAPISGMVTVRASTRGAWVENGDPMLNIVDFSRLQAVIRIYPDDQPRVKIGQQVTIVQNELSATGIISYLSPMADPQTGAVEARADIDNPDYRLRTNTPATARITIGEKAGLTVPVSALLHEEDHFIVFVQKGKEFEKRFVKTGIRNDRMVEIIDGVKEGEKIVTGGAYQLKNLAFSSVPSEEE